MLRNTSMCAPAVARYMSKRYWIASQVRCHTAASTRVVASQIRLVALLTAVELVVCRRNVWRNPRRRSRLVTGPEILVAKVPVPRDQSNFRAAAHPETLSRPNDNGVVSCSAGRLNDQEGPEPELNCSHIFWLMRPKTTLYLLLLRRHFRVRTVTALQWSESELPHVIGETWSACQFVPSYVIVVT